MRLTKGVSYSGTPARVSASPALYVSITRRTYLEVFQIRRHDIRAHFVPFNHITAIFGMPTHRTRPVAFVEPLVHILGCELQVSVATDGEGLRWSHGV